MIWYAVFMVHDVAQFTTSDKAVNSLYSSAAHETVDDAALPSMAILRADDPRSLVMLHVAALETSIPEFEVVAPRLRPPFPGMLEPPHLLGALRAPISLPDFDRARILASAHLIIRT